MTSLPEEFLLYPSEVVPERTWMRKYTNAEFREFISERLIGEICVTEEQAYELDVLWGLYKVKDAQNNLLGHIDACQGYGIGDVPDTIVIMATEAVIFGREHPLRMFDLFMDALKNLKATVSGAIVWASFIDPKAMSAQIDGLKADLTKFVASDIAGLNKAVGFFKRSSSAIIKQLHISTLESVNLLGRLISPEYNAFWVRQESSLAAMSNHVFSNSAQLAAYVHIGELMYYDAARRAGVDHDQAREESCKKSAVFLDKVYKDLRTYKKYPATVWGDMYQEFFGSGNEYIGKEQKIDTTGILAGLKDVTDEAKKVDQTMDRLGLYSEAFKEAGLESTHQIAQALQDEWSKLYTKDIRDFVKTVDRLNKEQDELKKSVAMATLTNAQIRATIEIIVDDPMMLNEVQKEAQKSWIERILQYHIFTEESK